MVTILSQNKSLVNEQTMFGTTSLNLSNMIKDQPSCTGSSGEKFPSPGSDLFGANKASPDFKENLDQHEVMAKPQVEPKKEKRLSFGARDITAVLTTEGEFDIIRQM